MTWLKELAARKGELVLLRTRRQSTLNGEVARQICKVDHLLLPSYYTWLDIFLELYDKAKYTAECSPPYESGFRHIVTKECLTIRIRSPIDYVCDDCVLLKNSMANNTSVRPNWACVVDQ